MKFHIDDKAQRAMANCFSVAADRFRENAKVMQQAADTGGNPMLSPNGAKMLAEEFTKQAQEASAFSQIFNAFTDTIVIEYEQDMEDDENPFHPESPEGRDWQRQFDKAAKAA